MVSPSPRPDPIPRPEPGHRPTGGGRSAERRQGRSERERPVAKDRATATRPVDENLRRLQEQAVSEGFLMPVDGIDGPQTREMFAKYREWKAEKARSEAAATEATAKAKREEAAAEAERARVETERVKAEAEKERIAGEAQKRKDEAAAEKVRQAGEERQQAIKTGLNIAFPLAGAAIGHKIASSVKATEAASVASRAANLAKLAKDVDKSLKAFEKGKGAAKTIAKKQLIGSVATADKLALTKTKGPWAALIAGMLVAEGGFSRFVAAPNVKNEVAKEALMQASSASLFAATTLLGERGLARALPTSGPNAAHLASIEKARALTAPAKTVGGNLTKQALQLTAPAKKGPKGGPGLLGKLALGVGVVAGVAAIVQSARAEGAAGALKTAAKMIDPTGLVEKIDNERSIADLAKEQAQARDAGRLEPVPNSVTAHIAEDVATGVTPAGQGELMRRVANAGLDNFYAGPRPAEFERRASSLALAGVAAREASGKPETRPEMKTIPTPPPAPSAHEPPKPRHVWDDYAREQAAIARRNNGL